MTDLDYLLERTAREGGVPAAAIRSATRYPRFVEVRHRFWHLAWTSTGHSKSAIGRYTGHDHTTVIKGIQKHSKRLRLAEGYGV